jgi:small subunit ribosomal protein S8
MNKSQISLLLAIKTASVSQKEKIKVSLNKISIFLLNALYKHGIIQNFIKLDAGQAAQSPKFLIFLRYFFNKPVVKNLKTFSKPSLKLYLRFADICLIHDKKHTLFLSTSKGILTNFECKLKKIGGIILFKC